MNYDKYRYRRLNLDDLETNKKYRFYKNDNYAIRTMPKEWISYLGSEEYKIKINNYRNFFNCLLYR